jgi:hypothetical protein
LAKSETISIFNKFRAAGDSLRCFMDVGQNRANRRTPKAEAAMSSAPYSVSGPFGPRVLYTNMGDKLFVTAGFVLLLHLIEGITSERTRRLELPVTLGAGEALKILALNPFQRAWHPYIIVPLRAKQSSIMLMSY